MGKGGYNGGSTVVGFSGAGSWVGGGSVTMQPASKKGRGASPRKKKPAKASPLIVPLTLKDDDELQRLSRRAKAIEADIKVTQSRLKVLNQQLQLATDQLRSGIQAKLPKAASTPRLKQ